MLAMTAVVAVLLSTVVMVTPALVSASSTPIQCTASSERPNWPTFHFFNNITKAPACYCSPAPCTCPGGGTPSDGGLVMEPLNDANAIFEFKGLYHVMMQAGGGNWTHGVSSSPAGPWYIEIDALSRATNASLPWDSHQGPCDGSASFPDLGAPPYDGSTPVILYGPDCNVPIDREAVGLRAGLGDAPRVEVALPKDPSDAMLRDWVKQSPGPVTFEGTPCSFPGHVWKSTSASGAAQWNMICALNGKAPWARFVSDTPTLMRWRLADSNFMIDAETGQPQPVKTCQSGAYFQRIPNPKQGGPTHMINVGSAGPMLLGILDNATQKFLVNRSLGPQVLDSSPAFRWGAVGSATDGRLLMVAWLQESGPCGPGQPKGFGACARSVTSMTRELLYDHATDQLLSRPVASYALLHNATFVDNKEMPIVAGSTQTLSVPASAGGALEVRVSFDLSALTTEAGNFGLYVRAPANPAAKGGVGLSFSVSAPDRITNTRVVESVVMAAQTTASGGGYTSNLLPFMNDTDLPGGNINSTHLPPGTDPHHCAALCMQCSSCMAWVYVIRGQPVGSGDCIFKNAGHGCPVPSPRSSSQGLCIAGRGNEPIDHKCNIAPQPPSASLSPVRVLKGETLDVQVFVECAHTTLVVRNPLTAYQQPNKQQYHTGCACLQPPDRRVVRQWRQSRIHPSRRRLLDQRDSGAHLQLGEGATQG